MAAAIKAELVISPEEWKKFSKYIVESIKEQIFAQLSRDKLLILQLIKEEIERRFYEAPEVISLGSGELRYLMGLDENIGGVLTNILGVILSNCQLSISNTRGGILIKFSILRSHYRDVLEVPGTQFISKGGHEIKWLEWLLTKGDDIILINYIVIRGNYPPSKSKGAITVKKKGGEWRVPPEFSGTEENNFLTKIMHDIDVLLDQTIERII